MTLETYLHKEISEGKTEFRLVARSAPDGSVVLLIHPCSKNGQTYDGYVRNNTVENMNLSSTMNPVAEEFKA